MSYKLIVLDEAEGDLLEAELYYEQAQAGLGDRFLNEVDVHIGYIVRNPSSYEIKYHNAGGDAVRWCNLRRFPYQIIYLIEDQTIFVLRPRYAGQDPATRPRLADGSLDA